MRSDHQEACPSRACRPDPGQVLRAVDSEDGAAPGCGSCDEGRRSRESALSLARLTLALAVTRDEEYVRLRVVSDGLDLDLGERGHNFLLLALARRRLADAREGWPDAACGWVHVEDWEHDPSLSPPKLNLDVFRIRQQLLLHRVLDAPRIIERRRTSRQIRLGTGRVTIAVL
jgi:hypothetical protein